MSVLSFIQDLGINPDKRMSVENDPNILQGKRFGFSLEEIRQLLNLYDIGDQQKTQLLKTYELAKERLKVMMNQKDELELAIEDLKKMLKWGEEVLISRGIKSNKN